MHFTKLHELKYQESTGQHATAGFTAGHGPVAHQPALQLGFMHNPQVHLNKPSTAGVAQMLTDARLQWR